MAHWCDEVDFGKISPNNPYGFEGFKSIGELCAEKCHSIPEEKGVYLILDLSEAKPGFNSSNTGFAANNKSPKATSELENNWVDDARVLYIGKAGGSRFKTNLKIRLRGYFKWLEGKPNAKHDGGRDIWQINKPEKLLVAWRVTNAEEPRACEHALIEKFERDFAGKLPFANQQR